MPETRRQFREGVVRVVRETGRPIAQVARELGSTPGRLGNWVAKDHTGRGDRPQLSEDERTELARLRAENTELRMERDVLKRPVVGWVDEAVGR